MSLKSDVFLVKTKKDKEALERVLSFVKHAMHYQKYSDVIMLPLGISVEIDNFIKTAKIKDFETKQELAYIKRTKDAIKLNLSFLQRIGFWTKEMSADPTKTIKFLVNVKRAKTTDQEWLNLEFEIRKVISRARTLGYKI